MHTPSIFCMFACLLLPPPMHPPTLTHRPLPLPWPPPCPTPPSQTRSEAVDVDMEIEARLNGAYAEVGGWALFWGGEVGGGVGWGCPLFLPLSVAASASVGYGAAAACSRCWPCMAAFEPSGAPLHAVAVRDAMRPAPWPACTLPSTPHPAPPRPTPPLAPEVQELRVALRRPPHTCSQSP